MSPQPDMNPDHIKQSIEDLTGYPFELEIVRRIETYKDYGYWIEPNFSFEDQDTGEARELDFHATKAMAISVQKSEFAFAVILGSCKANKNPYIFFTRQLPFAGITLDSDVPIAGYPLEIYTENSESEAIEWYFRLHDFLHIAKSNIVSSQFCELVWKNNKWEKQSEPIFKNTFVPLIKAMSREIQDYNKTHVPEKDDESPDYQIFYPLLVLEGPMYEYHVPPSGSPELKETKHILLIRHHESRTIKCCYAVDVIHEGYLEQYLGLVEKELKKFVNLVRRHKKSIVRSIRKLAELRDEEKT